MVASRIALVRAPNPSAMTLSGTNTYLVDCGQGRALCIDPGPAIERHVDAILAKAGEMQLEIALIALTHTHPDHAPAAPLLAKRTAAPVAAHEASEFVHDRGLRDGEVLQIGTSAIDVVEAPGHTFDHLVYYDREERALFTGDVVLGSGYVVVAPPNGSMRDYQRTLERLRREFPEARTIFGGHGEPVSDPGKKLLDYIAHRNGRQDEILGALGGGAKTIPDLVRTIYRDTDRALWPAAARQLLAYLIALEEEGRVRSSDAGRALNAEEHAILNPEWETIVGREHARTVEAELGAMLRLDSLRSYELA